MAIGQYYRRGSDTVWRSPGRAPIGSSFTAFTPGTVKPLGELDTALGARNVGPRPEVTLTPYYGDLVLSSGKEYSGLDIHGTVTTNASLASPPYIHDCIIRGKPNTLSGSGMALGKSYNLSAALFEWCLFDGTGNETLWLDGISGGNFTLRYCEIRRAVDGVHAVTPGNGTIEASRIYHGHYAAWWDDGSGAPRTATFTDFGGKTTNAPLPGFSSGDLHSDGIQIAGQSGWVVRGNYIGGEGPTGVATTQLDPTVQADYQAIQAHDSTDQFKNAAIIINAISATPVGAMIDKNWLHGGAARLNMSIAGSDTLGGVTVQNNRFIRSSYGFYIYAQTGNTATFSNNVFDDTGLPVTMVNW